MSALAINYLFFGLRKAALESRRGVAEPFVMLFRAFVDAYADGSTDRELFEVIPPFLAFRWSSGTLAGIRRWPPGLAKRCSGSRGP